MLDVKRLRVLREVAAHGSFSAAAEALSYTQSAVSQQIAALEREAGTTLVERGARGIRLTDAGRVRLASFPTAGASLVPLAIATFTKAHPAVELTLVEADPEESIPRLKAGE